MKKNTVRILEVLMIAMMIMVFIPMTAKAAEQEDSEIITAAELAKLLPAKDFEINVTQDDRGWNVVSVNIPFNGVSIERYIKGVIELKDTESDKVCVVDLEKTGNSLTGKTEEHYSLSDSSATYKVNKLEISGSGENTITGDFVYSICYYENPDGPGESDDVYICYLPEEEVPAITLKFTGALEIGIGENNKSIVPARQTIRLKFEPSVTGNYYLLEDTDNVSEDGRSWEDEDGNSLWIPIKSTEYEAGKTYYKYVCYDWHGAEQEQTPITFGIWMQLRSENEGATVSSVTLPETMAYRQLCQAQMTAESPNDIRGISFSFYTTKEANEENGTYVEAVSNGDIKYEGNTLSFDMCIDYIDNLSGGVAENSTLYLHKIFITDKYKRITTINVADNPSIADLNTTYVSVKSVIESGENSEFLTLDIYNNETWTIPQNAIIQTTTFYIGENGNLTLNGAGKLKVNRNFMISEGGELSGSNKMVISSWDNQIGDERLLDHLVGADTNCSVHIYNYINNVDKRLTWDGSTWKLKDDKITTVTNLINKLPETIKISDESEIKAAREEYNKLSEEQKKNIDAEILTKLEAAENQLKKIKADKAAADMVTEKINKLPAEVKLSDESTINAARAAFDKLSRDQKILVDSKVYDKLKGLETQLELLKNNNPVTRLSVLDSTIVLKKGASKTVTVFVTEADAAKVSTDTVELISSKKTVASASASNLKKGKLTFKVKGLKAGKSKITAKVGTQTVTVKITVLKKANKAKSVKAGKKKITVKPNKTKVITIRVTPKNKKFATTDDVKAISSKSQIALVTKISTVKGKVKVTVKGMKKGESTLTVKIGKKKANIKVKVQ